MIISISGLPGAGKTTIGRLLAEKLNFEYYSIGRIMREMALKKGISEIELSKIAEKDKSIDYELDDFQRSLAKRQKIVLDSRLGFYFIPDSIKIFLIVDLETGVKRIMKDEREEEHYSSLEEGIKDVKRRIESETRRYKKYYGIKDFRNKENYTFALDTTKLTIAEVLNNILKYLKTIDKNIEYIE